MQPLLSTKSIGHTTILILFCYLIINLSQFLAWFEYSGMNGVCPLNLSWYLFYESVSSVVYFVVCTTIIVTTVIMTSRLDERLSTLAIVVANICGVGRLLWNSLACYWLDTYPPICKNSPIYKMALASVILFFILNVPIILLYSRLVVEKVLGFFDDCCATVKPPFSLPKESGINLKDLINEPKFSDVQFLVDEATFYAHRVVLSARCEYFSTMLYGGMRESTQSNPIIIQEISKGSFLLILEFIYTNNIKDLSNLGVEEICDLMKSVDLLAYNGMKDFLEIWMRNHVTSDNIIPFLVASHKYNFNFANFALERLSSIKGKLHLIDAQYLKGEPQLMIQVVESCSMQK